MTIEPAVEPATLVLERAVDPSLLDLMEAVGEMTSFVFEPKVRMSLGEKNTNLIT